MLLRIVTSFQLLLLVLFSIASLSHAQDNAQLTIARALRRCYQDRSIFERDSRLPMTPQMLIELIRKVEDNSGYALNMRQLATSLLFYFKQDGIRRKQKIYLTFMEFFMSLSRRLNINARHELDNDVIFIYLRYSFFLFHLSSAKC